MRILMLSPYCYPEQVSSSHLTNDLFQAFANYGIDVEIFTPTPCRGIDKATREKYKSIKVEKYNNTITIHRFALFAEGKNVIGRAFRYVLCNIIQIHLGSKAEKVDILYSASTPPTQGLMMGAVKKRLSKRKGQYVPFIYNLQDVFPDSLVTSGMTSKGSLIWKIGRKIEDLTYKYADKIIVISEDIKKNIIEKGVPKEKIVVIPNWIDTSEVVPISREDNKLFDELGINRDKFIIVYAGNLGMAQGIDTFIDAAKQIEDVEFLIFGEGSSKEEYAERCAGYKNIHMFPLMPRNRVSEVYSMGNMCLVACKKGTGAGAVPSKTFSIMATGTPVLLSFDEGTALWKLIQENECGVCTHAGDSDELVKAIQSTKQNRFELLKMGNRARTCVEQAYSKESNTTKVITTILDVVKGS